MKCRPKRLRWQLAAPLTVAFALLWLGTMALLTNFACGELEQRVNQKYRSAHTELEEQWEYYENNLSNGLGERANHIMASNLSSAALELTGIGEGGMALLARDDAGNQIRSQLAWGYGHKDGVDRGQRWYLYFDGGLDDQGQIALARWIVEHRSQDWGYTIYPPDSWWGRTAAEDENTSDNFDGTYARVTGIEQPGFAVEVQKIELVHPDGRTETMVQTDTQGENPITLDLKYMKVNSVLLPPWSNNKDVSSNMELRLSNFREAQAILDRDLSGEQPSVLTRGGRLSGSYGADGLPIRVVAGQCDILPAAIQQQWFLYFSSFLLTAAAVLILSGYLSQKVTRPVEDLSQAAQKGRRLEEGPVTELNTLASAFNGAQDQLEKQLERERAFTRAAAHELKTPLAILRTHTEALREDIAPEKREQYWDVVLDESDRMAQLVGRLLELTRLESEASLNVESVELSALVKEVWSPLLLQAGQKGIAITQELEQVTLEGDRERLKEAIRNLASNALQYCPPQGCIKVKLSKEQDTASLSIYNDGPPIPSEDLPHLFEPFYRGDKSRNRSRGGTGLGLSIVQAAVSAHGGSCFAENQKGGVCFQLSIPITPINME